MSGITDINEFHRKILDSIWIGVWAVDKYENIVFFNKGMEYIFGTPKEKVLGTNVLRYIKEQSMRDQKHFCELFCRVKRTVTPAPYDSLSMITRKGNLTYQSGVLVPLLDDRGNYDGMVGTVEDITERKLSEKQTLDFLKTEKELEMIYKSSPVVAFLWLADGNRPVEYVSDNLDQFGYNAEDFTSGRMNYSEIIFPDDLEKFQSHIRKDEAEGSKYFSQQYRILTKDGKVRWVSERSLIVRDENYVPAYHQGIVIDITKQKKSQEALLEAEKKYRLIFENSPLGIFDFDNEGVVRHCNDNLIKILGLPKEEIVGFNLMTSLRDEKMKAAFESVLSKKSGHYEGEYKSTTADKVTPIRACYSPNISEDGLVLGGIGIIEDITERKMSYDALKASEEKYSSLVENGNDGIVIIQEHVLKFANSKFEDLTGYSKEEMIGKSFFEFISPEYRDIIFEMYEMRSKKDPTIPHKYEIYILSKEGEKVATELNTSYIIHNGKPADMAIIRDITERKKAEKALKEYAHELARANEELKSLDRMKDEFLSNVSHELNTPIVSIKGYSDLVYDETLGNINDKQKDALEVVLRNTQRLISVVNSLLYISMMESEAIEYKFEDVLISNIIDNVADDMTAQIKKKSLSLQKNVPADLPPVKGDREKLATLFTNLMDNAIKFTDSGGQITFEAEEEKQEEKEEQNFIHIKISDTGIGISKELIPKLFQRFYQIDASTKRKYGGTGLGLYISKSIVDAHEGQIWIESAKDAGTTIHVRLPCQYSKT
ncbi:PAS domain S-box protein [uncultured Methanolobus sp.]|uniref:PAS domain S-box protein n=1 Tax=uncultured Methanolobus sp. TaxID=218300 RepID=UPI0029C6C95E|nr:PAS domain S-box protein [uncultured Methanolobus sp.]